jgi:hypothetical protein
MNWIFAILGVALVVCLGVTIWALVAAYKREYDEWM